MHNDLHLGNIFLKICDETLYNNKPLKSYESFEYDIYEVGKDEPIKIFIPNMGFIIKIGDMGHASVSYNSSTAIKNFNLRPHDVGYYPDEEIILRKLITYDSYYDSDFLETDKFSFLTAKNFIFNPVPFVYRSIRNVIKNFISIPKENLINSNHPFLYILRKFLDDLGAQHIDQILSSYDFRRNRYYNPAFDLGTLMNHLSTRPWGFFNKFVTKYGRIERYYHNLIHGDLNNYRYFMAFNTLGILTKYPTFTLPHFYFCYTIPSDLLTLYINDNPMINNNNNNIFDEIVRKFDIINNRRSSLSISNKRQSFLYVNLFGKKKKNIISFQKFQKNYKNKEKALKKYMKALNLNM